MATDVNALTERYIALRDRKAEVVRKHKETIATYDEALNAAEAALLAIFESMGIDSVGTEHGTAYRSKVTSATVADWDPLLDFIKTTGNWQFLERRVSKVAVEEFAAATHGDMPPGINYSAMTTINVRRK